MDSGDYRGGGSIISRERLENLVTLIPILVLYVCILFFSQLFRKNTFVLLLLDNMNHKNKKIYSKQTNFCTKNTIKIKHIIFMV